MSKIRSSIPDDAGQIAAIYNHYVANTIATFEEDPVSVAQMRDRIESGSARYPWLVATRGQATVGYAYAGQWKSRSAYRNSVETTVYVAPTALRQGVGSELYSALLGELRHRRFHCALGLIALPNPASVALHENLGFSRVAELEEVGWKMGRWVDVGIWQLILSRDKSQ